MPSATKYRRGIFKQTKKTKPNQTPHTKIQINSNHIKILIFLFSNGGKIFNENQNQNQKKTRTTNPHLYSKPKLFIN